jgi:hypothetical protein
MVAKELISEIEAINIVGRAIFADGWLGEARRRDNKMILVGLSSEDGELIELRGPRTGKRGGTTIEPCPQTIEPLLDQALGRRMRAEAQRGKAADWLIEHDLRDDQGKGYDRDAIVTALKLDPPKPSDAPTPRGRPPRFKVIGAVMLDDVASGRRTQAEIKNANNKNLQNWYDADPATCKKARDHVF